MANPLKVLAALSASAGAVVSGSDGLKVKQGGLAVEAGTLSAGQVNLTGVLSSSSNITASALSIVGGATVNALTVSSGVASLASASFSGDVTVVGNLTVKGTTTSVESTTVNIGDINLSLGTGSTTLNLIHGAGLSLGSGSLVTLNYISSSDAWTSNKNFDLGGTGVYKLQGTTVLSGTTLGSTIVTSSLTSVGTLTSLTVSGQADLQGTVKLGNVSGDSITVSGTLAVSSSSGQVNDVAGLLTSLSSSVAGGSLVHASSYNGLRIVLTHELVIEGEDSVFELTGANVVYGLSGSTDAALATVLAGASFDVAVRPVSSDYWTNDLVSVHVTGSASGSAVYPKFVVGAPALEAGASIRLIVVNENENQIA